MESMQPTPPPSRRLPIGLDTEAPSCQVQQHAQFWFEDGNVTLQVEDTQFKLHRSLLSLSCGTFHDMFLVGGHATSDATDQNPLLLPGRPLGGFVLLCRAIYATWGNTLTLSVKELVELLDTALFYNATDIYARAVAELGRMPLGLVERIVYGQRFAIDDWVASAFVAFGRSLRPLSATDAGAIGWRLSWQITSAQKAIVHRRLMRVLCAGGSAGCCNACYVHYISPYFPPIIVHLSSDPVNVTEDVDEYIRDLTAELKALCFCVGTCGNTSCESWPTVEHVTNWLDISAEEQVLRGMLASING